MRHVYFRGIVGLIWLAAAAVSGVSGRLEMAGLYVILCAVFLYTAFTAWRRERDSRGGR